MKMSDHFPELSIAGKRICGACKNVDEAEGELKQTMRCVIDAASFAVRNHDALVEALQTINELSMCGADVESYLDETVVPLLAKLESE